MQYYLASLILLSSVAAQAQTFYYEQPATIQGKLLKIKSLHPNQEQFGGNQIALALDQQINVDGEEDLVKTKLIQLVDVNNARYNAFFKKEGKSAKINCSSLFRAHTAHHTTKVLCFVKSVTYQ